MCAGTRSVTWLDRTCNDGLSEEKGKKIKMPKKKQNNSDHLLQGRRVSFSELVKVVL